ncbi:hypothetical protein IRB23SM22_09580 [Alkalibacterium sp. s-m-22]
MSEEKERIRPIPLHLELVSDHMSDEEQVLLKRYGESSTGTSINRDILIPADLTLHALHYTVQKLFGWQNSHLRRFLLSENDYKRVTDGTVRGWSDLVGTLFQPPSEGEHDLFWDDDYDSGNFNSWLRKKYTGPYDYRGHYEQYEVARQDVEMMLDRFPDLEIRESFSEFMDRKNSDSESKPEIRGRSPLINMTIEEMNRSLFMETGTEDLLEKLLVDELIGYEGEQILGRGFPVADELFYEYDFGDGWRVRITKRKSCEELLRSHLVTVQEIEEANTEVLRKHRPVCLAIDGLSVMDDVGGLSGFARFLGEVHQGDSREESAVARRWAKSMGWKDKKVRPSKLL